MQIHSTKTWEQTLGDEIRAVRLLGNLTQEEVARRANIDRTTVARLERGEGGTIGTLIRVARVLGREDWLSSFAPVQATVSPMAVLRSRQAAAPPKTRRARGSVVRANLAGEPSDPIARGALDPRDADRSEAPD